MNTKDTAYNRYWVRLVFLNKPPFIIIPKNSKLYKICKKYNILQYTLDPPQLTKPLYSYIDNQISLKSLFSYIDSIHLIEESSHAKKFLTMYKIKNFNQFRDKIVYF